MQELVAAVRPEVFGTLRQETWLAETQLGEAHAWCVKYGWTSSAVARLDLGPLASPFQAYAEDAQLYVFEQVLILRRERRRAMLLRGGEHSSEQGRECAAREHGAANGSACVLASEAWP